jgi:hypothetical protein
MNKVAKICQIYGNSLNPEHIIELLDIIAVGDDYFLRRTTLKDCFFTIDDIEQLVLDETSLSMIQI